MAEAGVRTRASAGTLATGSSDEMWPGDKSEGDVWPGDDSAESVGAGIAARKKNVEPEMMRLLQEWKLEGEVERLEARGVTSVEDLGCMTAEEVGLFGLPLRFRAMIRHINEEQCRTRSVTTASPRELEQEARSGQTMSRDVEGVAGGRALRRRQPWEQDEEAVSGEKEHWQRRAGLLREFDEAFAHAVQEKPNKLLAATAARNVEHLDVHHHAPHTVHGYRAGVGLGTMATNDASCSSRAANAKGTPRVGTRAILPHTWGGDSGSSRGHSPVSIFPKALFNHENGQGLQLVGQATHDMQVTQDMDHGSSPNTTHMQQHAAQSAETRTESSVHRPTEVREEADMLEKVLVLLFFAGLVFTLVFTLGVAAVDLDGFGGNWRLWGGMKKMANSSAFEMGLSHPALFSGSTAAGESATLLKATLLKDAIKDELRQQASAAAAAEAAAAAAAAVRIEVALESARAVGAGEGVSAAPSLESTTRDVDMKAAPKGHGRSSLVAAAAKGVKYTVRCGVGLAALVLMDKAIFA